MDYFLLSKILRPLLTFSNLFIIFILVFFFLKKWKIYKLLLQYLILIYLIIGIIPIGHYLKYHILNKDFLNKPNKLDFDSILVLSGSEARYLRAINFQKQNPSSKLIFTGGSGLIYSKDKSEELNNFKEITKNLISNDKLIVLNNSRNTIENLKSFKKANQELKFKKTALITTYSHYKRSLLIAKKLDLKLTPYYYQVHQPSFSILNSYQNYSFSKNWGNFDKFMHEIIGILRVTILKL